MLIVNVAAKRGALGIFRGTIPTHLQGQGDDVRGVMAPAVKRNRRRNEKPTSGQSASDGRIDWLSPPLPI